MENGRIIYTPNTGYTGLDSFIYRVSDGKGGTDTATVTINITPGGQSTENTVYLPATMVTVNVTVGAQPAGSALYLPLVQD